MTDDTWAAAPRCTFHIRTQVTDKPTYRYQQVHLANGRGDGSLWTPHPPLVGDLISLYDGVHKEGGTYRVIQRDWAHSSHGSTNWPWTESHPSVGPMLTIIVEAVEGLFVSEEPGDDDE